MLIRCGKLEKKCQKLREYEVAYPKKYGRAEGDCDDQESEPDRLLACRPVDVTHLIACFFDVIADSHGIFASSIKKPLRGITCG
jgi:hypothetical protein